MRPSSLRLVCRLVIKMAEKMKERFSWILGPILLFGLKREVRLFGLDGSLSCCWAAVSMAEDTRQHFSLVPAALQIGL